MRLTGRARRINIAADNENQRRPSGGNSAGRATKIKKIGSSRAELGKKMAVKGQQDRRAAGQAGNMAMR